jgi:hypothetical protein
LKSLHRLIVTSETYRQASTVANAAAEKIDPGNALLWRGKMRRKLEAEACATPYSPSAANSTSPWAAPAWQDFVIERPEHSPHFRYDLANPDDPKTWRRSIYRFIVRSQTQPWMTSLDCADPVDARRQAQRKPLPAAGAGDAQQRLRRHAGRPPRRARATGAGRLKRASRPRARASRSAAVPTAGNVAPGWLRSPPSEGCRRSAGCCST